MDFARFLYHTRRLTKQELYELLTGQLQESLRENPRDANGFASRHLNEIDPLAPIREVPFGEVLANSPVGQAALARQSLDVRTLVEEWQCWHRDCLEPIGIYSISSRFGLALYERQLEKQLVARFLVSQPVRNGATIIRNHDVVVIPEGSSGTYVGLAIAAVRSEVTVATSNAPLIREYRDNPFVARKFREFNIFGGRADYSNETQRAECGGVHGAAFLAQFRTAIKDADPAITIVVMPVSGLLAHEGPFVAGPTAGIKRTIIEESLRHGVREVVFIADYTKQMCANEGNFGVPLFSVDAWKDLLAEYPNAISVVTAPPPAMRNALAFGQGKDPRKRILDAINNPIPFAGEDADYNRNASRLAEIVGTYKNHGQYQPLYHEAHELLDKQSLVVFTIDEVAENVNLEQFSNSLRRLVDSANAKFIMNLKSRDARALVIVAGSKGDLDGVGSFCSFKSARIAEFMRATRCAVVEMAVGGAPTKYELSKEWMTA